MRNFSIWRHALLALSLLTLSSTALATTPGTAKNKPEPASQAASPSKTKATRAKARHKTAQAAKTHSATAERSRQPSSHTTKSATKASKPADAKADAKADSKKNPAPAAKPAARSSKSAKPDGRATAPHGKTAKRAETKAHPEAPKACTHDPVTIVRGADNHSENLVLTRCNGRPTDGALEKLTHLIAPNIPPRTTADTKGKPARHVNPGIKSLDPGVLSRVQAIASHYPGKAIRIASSYRPMAARSYHQTGRALDMVVTGVSNEDLVAFCRTLPDTGCGYYPNSSFIHLDVRSPGTGHVYWIDASKPGEAPRYVSSWPEKSEPGEKPATPPPGVHADEHPHEHAESEHGAAPAVNTPPAQPLTGDLELDSKTDDRK